MPLSVRVLLASLRRVSPAIILGVAFTWLALALVTAGSASAATIRYVDGNCPHSPVTNTLCTDGVTSRTIAAALAKAVNGDTIVISTTNPHIESGLTVNKSVTIQGLGMFTTVVEPAAAPSVSNTRVLNIASGVSVTISALTLRYGHSSGDGGGIYNNHDTLTLNSVAVLSNTAENNGGGIFNNGESGTGTLNIVDSLVQGNTSNSDFGGGGGLYNSADGGHATVNIQTSRFLSNTAPNTSLDGGGGAIANEILDYNAVATVSILSSTLAYNTTAADFGGGGAIYNLAQDRSFSDTSSLARVAITASMLYSNQANSDAGGAIWTGALDNASRAELTVFNSTLADNSASSGGAIHSDLYNRHAPAGVTISFVTVTYSTLYANLGGGAVDTGLSNGAISSTITLNGSILSGNAGNECTNSFHLGTTLGSNNLIDDSSCGASNPFNLGSAAGTLGALHDNGGGTLTDALLPGSPAIDAGAAGPCPATDQRGVLRPQNAACDAGAYETRAPTLQAISPSAALAGSPGFSLTLTGTGFISGASVLWNGSPLSTTFLSSTVLTASVATGDLSTIGFISVTVENPGPDTGDGLVTGAQLFGTSAPAATLTAISPVSTSAADPGFTLTLTGTNFYNGAHALWNGSQLVTTFLSATKLTAVVPSGKLTAAGSVTVTVANPAPSLGLSNILPFTITKAAQTITFDALSDRSLDESPFNVSATATSGLTVTFGATGDCSVVGTQVTLNAAGSCTLTASQAGSGAYLAAPNVVRTFTIQPVDTQLKLYLPLAMR